MRIWRLNRAITKWEWLFATCASSTAMARSWQWMGWPLISTRIRSPPSWGTMVLGRPPPCKTGAVWLHVYFLRVMCRIIYTHTHTCACMHAHKHTHMHAHTHTHSHTHMHTCMHTHIYTHTHAHTLTHTCTHTHTRTSPCLCICFSACLSLCLFFCLAVCLCFSA